MFQIDSPGKHTSNNENWEDIIQNESFGKRKMWDLSSINKT